MLLIKRNSFSFILLVHSLFVSAQTKELQNFGSNPGNLRGYVHTSSGLSDSLKYPLVIALHGCNQDAQIVEEQSGWSVLADSNHFYVLYPEQKRINNVNNCFNWFFKGDCTKDKGEVASIHQMMVKVCDSLNVDTTRVFVYGMSAGALMAVSLAACYPDELKGCASLAGGPYTGGLKPGKGLANMIKAEELSNDQHAMKVKKQNPGYKGKYPKLIVLHGEKDMVVDYSNADQLLYQWIGLMNSQDLLRQTINDFDGVKALDRTEFQIGVNESFAIFYSMKDAGHTLPVNPGTGEKQGGKTGLFATDMDFFSTWYIANDFGLLE